MESAIHDTFAKTLRTLRLERGFTQKQLSLAADLHRSYVSLLERQMRKPNLGAVIKIALALDIDACKFIDAIYLSLHSNKPGCKAYVIHGNE